MASDIFYFYLLKVKDTVLTFCGKKVFRAITWLLQDAGVSLLKTDAQTIDLKKIDIEVVGDDPNGNTIIIINDCN